MLRAFGGLAHLSRRFVRSLRPRYPEPADQRMVGECLGAAQSALFWAQPPADLAHSVAVARRIPGNHPEWRGLVEAALLHDVGKAAAGIGTARRSLATLLAAVHLPTTPRMRRYLDHGEIGAALLQDAGSAPLAISFARHHREEDPPPGVDPSLWELLRWADHEG